jgi:hypothetical protein
MSLKFVVLQEIAKKKAKADTVGPLRPPREACPSAQADAEVPEAGAKAPEGSGAKAPGETEAPAPPPPQV